MAVSWGFTVLLAVTIVALFTFSQPLFQLALPEAIEKQTQTELEIVSQAAVLSGHNPQLSSKLELGQQASDADGSSSRTTAAWSFDSILRRGTSRRQRWTRKLIQRRPPCSGDLKDQLPGGQSTSPVINEAKPRGRSVLASFQSDRMVPTGPNPLHNSNRSQVIFP